MDTQSLAAPSHDDIQVMAYEMWQRDGCPQGCDLSYWLNAEELLKRPVQDGQPKQDGELGKPVPAPVAGLLAAPTAIQRTGNSNRNSLKTKATVSPRKMADASKFSGSRPN
jgi:hypothetical protein